MITLKEFDRLVRIAHEDRSAGEALIRRAESIEDMALRLAGVEHVDREPGFACWRVEGVGRWFNTPRDAVEAAEKRG